MIGSIAGEIRFDRALSDVSVTRAMCSAETHKGPCDEGYRAKGSVSLGIRSQIVGGLGKGLWPLGNENGTIYLVADGEIHGLPSLRRELELHGHTFRSRTSLETIVHGYEEWGTECLEKLDGVFAFSIWDEGRQLLFLARDRFGFKPIHYHQGKAFFAFASEIKALLRHPHVSAVPNESVIRRYLHNGLADSREETFFVGIDRLPPASCLLIDSHGQVEKREYWTPKISRKLDGSATDETIKKTRSLFLDAVGQQLATDLPMGASLSGGIDSSSVVCAMRRIRPAESRIRTFSVIFPGDPIDETEYARTVCNATEAENYTVRLTADEFWRDLPTLVRCQEEPFTVSTVYAQWRLMKCASEHGVKVMLEGHGGDELLCGYTRYYFYYFMTLLKQRRLHRLLIEALLSRDLTKIETKRLIKTYLPIIAPYMASLVTRILRARKSASNRNCASPQDGRFYRALTTDLAAKLKIEVMLGSLPTALRHVERNSAWHRVEVRLPFLERRFAEHCASLPLDQKIRDGSTKHAFRLAMKDILPEQIRLRRRKIGFQIPIDQWIQTELRQRLRVFFSDSNLKGTRYYSKQTAERILSRSTLTDRETGLISRMLNLELWHREFFR